MQLQKAERILGKSAHVYIAARLQYQKEFGDILFLKQNVLDGKPNS